MRLFVGVDVPPIALAGAHLGTREAPSHLTVLFLGEVPAERAAELAEAFRAAVRARPPFALELAGIGGFPGPDRPRIVWIGVARGAPELTALHGDLRGAARAHGIPTEERPFVAHLTVLRVRGARDQHLAQEWLAQHRETRFAECRVDRLLLKESRVGAGPVVHRTIAELPLEGAPGLG